MADVDCLDGSLSLNAPVPTPPYSDPERMTLPNGASVTSGTVSLHGYRAFCATVTTPRGG